MTEIRVKGGTNAGWRSPFDVGTPLPWQCSCLVYVDPPPPPSAGDYRTPKPKTNPGYLVACPDCGSRRTGS